MLKISQAIIVEGKYDKIKLSSIIDALIIEINGFQIYKDKEKSELIKIIAEQCGIIIMTDSDSAGMMIRNKISEIAKNGKIYHAYIPEIIGKEKRKTKPSSEGLLGVEGVKKEIILTALNNCGINLTDSSVEKNNFTTAQLYSLGLSGKSDSKTLRKALLQKLNLPQNISKNNLLKILPYTLNFAQLKDMCDSIKEEIKWQEIPNKK